MRRTVTFNISGQAMNVIMGSDLYEHPEQYDPTGCVEVREAAEALRYGDVTRRGRGVTHEITATPAAAAVILNYCQTVGATFRAQEDLGTRRDGDALLLVADRIMWRLKELAG